MLTNNLTSKPGEDNQWYLCPALGDTHTHKIGQRILLGRNPKEKDHYVAYLEKVKLSPPVYIGFKVRSLNLVVMELQVYERIYFLFSDNGWWHSRS